MKNFTKSIRFRKVFSFKAAGSVSYSSTLNVAIVGPFGALSLFTDFENMSEFKPGEHHNESIENTIDQTVLWAKALKTIR